MAVLSLQGNVLCCSLNYPFLLDNCSKYQGFFGESLANFKNLEIFSRFLQLLYWICLKNLENISRVLKCAKDSPKHPCSYVSSLKLYVN